MCPHALYAHSAAAKSANNAALFAVYGSQTGRTGRGFDGNCGKIRLVSAIHRDQRRMLLTLEGGQMSALVRI